MSKSKSLANKHDDQCVLKNAKRTELIFNAYILFQSRQSYSEPFKPELLVKWLEVIEAEINRAYPLDELRGHHG